MTTVSNIISRVSTQLNDAGLTRWTEPELLDWVNEAAKQIVILLPEVTATLDEIKLQEGTRQTIPADGVRLIDVLRNTGTEGGKPSGAIRIVERDVLDTSRPNWHSDRAASRAKNFVFDPRDPKAFYVYPPSRGQFAEIIYSKMPAKMAAADELGAFEIYSAAIINYALHRAYAKDTEEGSANRSMMYEQSFLSAIGLFDRGNMKAQPNFHAPPKNKSTGETY